MAQDYVVDYCPYRQQESCDSPFIVEESVCKLLQRIVDLVFGQATYKGSDDDIGTNINFHSKNLLDTLTLYLRSHCIFTMAQLASFDETAWQQLFRNSGKQNIPLGVLGIFKQCIESKDFEGITIRGNLKNCDQQPKLEPYHGS